MSKRDQWYGKVLSIVRERWNNNLLHMSTKPLILSYINSMNSMATRRLFAFLVHLILELVLGISY